MSKAGNDYFGDKIDDAVNYCRKEFDMSYGEMISLLMFAAHNLMHEAEDDFKDKE